MSILTLPQALKEIEHQQNILDAQCVQVFGSNLILTIIIKYSCFDFNHLSIKEIYSALKDKKNGNYPIDQTQIHQENTVWKSQIEGNRYMDLFFSVMLRNKQGKKEKFYFNIEIQNQYEKGYSLYNRGEYQTARAVSAQYNKEFKQYRFDDIKKVYFIWICCNPTLQDSNTIECYPKNGKQAIYGIRKKKDNYGKQKIILICLSRKRIKSRHPLLYLLNTIIDEKLNFKEKIDAIEKITNIEINENDKEEIRNMCNYSKGVLDRGRKEGITIGKKDGINIGKKLATINNIINLMESTGVDCYQAMSMLKINSSKQKEYKDLITKKTMSSNYN